MDKDSDERSAQASIVKKTAAEKRAEAKDGEKKSEPEGRHAQHNQHTT